MADGQVAEILKTNPLSGKIITAAMGEVVSIIYLLVFKTSGQ